MTDKNFIPDFPKFPELTEDLIDDCRSRGSYMPIAFDAYRTVAIIATYFAHIETRSPILAELPINQRNIYRGLLSRITRLMRAIMRLGHKKRDKEAILILGRAVTESAVKLMWLIQSDQYNRALLFVEAGLSGEVSLKGIIDQNIAKRGSEIPLETRMLRSIRNTADAGGFKIEDVRKKIELPNMFKMLEAINLEDLYMAIQKGPSSSVHGDWADLFLHYLKEHKGELMPLTKESRPEDAIFLSQAMVVIISLTKYIQYIITDGSLKDAFVGYLNEGHDIILWMLKDSGSDEFVLRQENSSK